MQPRFILTLISTISCAGPLAADIPRPEHPEPQAVRSQWLNLNGTWEFAETDDAGDLKFLGDAPYPDKIVVPYCRESRLSGLQRTGFVKYVWYRRTFDAPLAFAGRRVLLHIGACDWRTTVWVNGRELGTHTGGNTPITWEVREPLKPRGNVIIVRAFDDTRSGLQQLGKQSDRLESYGIMYTRTTGIWQTVWLEAVGTTFIRHFTLLPDPDSSRVTVQADLDGPWNGLEFRAEIMAGDKTVGEASAPASWRNNVLPVVLSEKHPWSPETPFLYAVKLRLTRQGAADAVDHVDSYFGLRKVEILGRQFLINGKPVFQRLVLDQGFYPDGVWTAPSDAALKHDIELSMAAGFNGARLHQKVFEPRFHYWADKLGYLTWGETPSFGANYGRAEVNLPIIAEWTDIVQRDRNHPSIVGWCPFNETPREAGPIQNVIVDLTHALDPARPIIDTSGYIKSHPDPDVDCRHDYDQDGGSLAARWANIGADPVLPPQYGIRRIDRPFFLSEFGGIGWIPKGQKGWGYGNSPKTPDEFYSRYDALTRALIDNRFMMGFCYTQLTDVEQERNGIYYYDRSPKFDMARIKALTSRPAAYENSPLNADSSAMLAWVVVVPAAVDRTPGQWRYTTDAPRERWRDAAFDDSAWSRGAGGFGHKDGWERRIGTPWRTRDIWLRRTFDYDGGEFKNAVLVMHYDNQTQVAVNGRPILSRAGWNDDYAAFDVTDALRPVLVRGQNTLAVHTHQDEGGQFIDVALLLGRTH